MRRSIRPEPSGLLLPAPLLLRPRASTLSNNTCCPADCALPLPRQAGQPGSHSEPCGAADIDRYARAPTTSAAAAASSTILLWGSGMAGRLHKGGRSSGRRGSRRKGSAAQSFAKVVSSRPAPTTSAEAMRLAGGGGLLVSLPKPAEALPRAGELQALLHALYDAVNYRRYWGGADRGPGPWGSAQPMSRLHGRSVACSGHIAPAQYCSDLEQLIAQPPRHAGVARRAGHVGGAQSGGSAGGPGVCQVGGDI